MSNGMSADPRPARPELNQVQREAAAYDGGPRLVFAGAGTGKTRVLTAAIAHLIHERSVPPGSIFAATFTNKAAREMRSRVEALTGLSCQGLWIGTFHSLCVRILRREAHRIGYEPSFAIYDEDDQESVLRQLCKRLGIDERAMTLGAARAAVSRWKNDGIPPEEAAAAAAGYQAQLGAKLYGAYQQALRRLQAMDFDDLLVNAVSLFRDHRDVRDRYGALFRYVLVDEYQDTNRAQFQLVRLLAQTHGNVFVVGDDDQSIYGWRGALVENILSFERAFPGTRVFRLEQNYRSPRAVLDFANAVIAPNRARAPKALWTASDRAAEVTVTCYPDDRREAEDVCAQIAGLIARGARPCDVMVLYRTNAQSRPFEEALRRARIAYNLVGGISFYQRREVKDCLAYLRLLANPADDVSFERIMNVPARGLGPRAREELAAAAGGAPLLAAVLQAPGDNAPAILRHRGVAELRAVFGELKRVAQRNAAPVELLRQVLTLTGYLTRLESEHTEESAGRVENVNELLNAVARWSQDNPQAGLTAFLEEVALVTDADTARDESLRVNCMTLHSAKGLEAPHVFIAGLEDGLLPARQNMEDERKLEEERRLLYVGVTRAQCTLHCSYARERWRFGSVQPMARSRFLGDVAPALYRFEDRSRGDAPGHHTRRIAARPRPQPSFEDYSQEEVQLRMGQRVRHKVFGTGTVLSVSGSNEEMRVTVLFGDGERRRMIARFAGLETL